VEDTKHILVVDDDDGIRFFLESALRRAGYDVTTAANGEEALQLLRNTCFDLAVLDLRLGGRIDGLRILEAIKWRWPQTAAIILTAYGSLDSAMAAIREGVDGYLLKPTKAEEFRQAVEEALGGKKHVAQSPAGESESQTLATGPFVADLEHREVSMKGVPLDLSASDAELLIYLMKNTQRVVPPTELVKVVRNYESSDLQEARDIIKWYIYRLRRRVEPNPSRPRYILNVRGSGYTLKE
jgi:DNA-binding response OmpR family regulator